MSKSIVAEGKTTNEAIEKGLKELKVTKNMVDIKVLESGFPIHYAKDYLQGELEANAHSSASQTSATGNCRVEETDTLITLHSPAVTVSFRKSDATITSVIRNADSRVIPLKDGPVAVGMKMILFNLSARTENASAKRPE